MLVRRIQNRLLVQLAIASTAVLACSIGAFLWLVAQEHSEEYGREARLVLELARLGGGAAQPQQELERIQAAVADLGGQPEVFLWTEEGVLRGREGEGAAAALPRGLLDELLVAKEWPFSDGGFSYWLGAADRGAAGTNARAIVRFAEANVLLSAMDRYRTLLVLGVGLIAVILGGAFYSQGRFALRPLTDLVLRIEQRIDGFSGALASGVRGENEIQRLYRRYDELTEVLDRQREELRLRSQELRQLLDALPAYVWYKDGQNNIIRVNRSGAESVGLTIEELEGKSVAEVFPEEADAYYRDDREVIESGKAKLGYVETYTPAKGKPRTIRTDKIPYVESSGEITGVVALVTDISELVDLQEERQASDRLIRRLVEIGNWEETEAAERIAAALKDTCETLGLKTGVLSEIAGSRYTVRQVYDERGLHAAGDSCDLDDVYCSFVLATGRSVASNHVGSTGWAKRECYEKLGLESCIASPVRKAGRIVGTISFSSPEIRPKPFTQFEVDAVRILSNWVEGLFRQQETVDQLNRQRAELRLILDTTPSQIWFKDDRNRVVRANRAAAASLGRSVEEVEGKPGSEIFPGDAEGSFAEDRAVMESGVPKLGSIRRGRSQTDSNAWVRYDKIPYELGDGQKGLIAVVNDITELVESQKTAKEAEEKFRMAVEASPVGMLIVDEELRVVRVNSEAERIFGYAREELLWRPVLRVLGPRVERALRCVFEAEERVAGQVRLGGRATCRRSARTASSFRSK